jgi:hypothetical protein
MLFSFAQILTHQTLLAVRCLRVKQPCRRPTLRGVIHHSKVPRDPEGHVPVPEPHRKLGAIQPLWLFLSTTVDSLLANALGSPADHVFAYSPNSTPVDIPRDCARSPHRAVFHLFGRISGIPDSALIDEETLEFIWKLHEESMSVRLANLFDELRTKHLLLIGNAHPDWLARFFVRLARRERLYSGNDAREFVADGAVVTDVHLRDFLENFSPQTKSFGVANPAKKAFSSANGIGPLSGNSGRPWQIIWSRRLRRRSQS